MITFQQLRPTWSRVFDSDCRVIGEIQQDFNGGHNFYPCYQQGFDAEELLTIQQELCRLNFAELCSPTKPSQTP